jgi:hypothetical protein
MKKLIFILTLVSTFAFAKETNSKSDLENSVKLTFVKVQPDCPQFIIIEKIFVFFIK